MSDARRRILQRRARFVAAALSATSLGCERPTPCLQVTAVEHENRDTGLVDSAVSDASVPEAAPHPCLSEVPDPSFTDAAPVPCLVPPPHDAAPVPCLGPKLPGAPDAAPKPCLLY
ncbi:MAG: hypothetical protein JNL79_15225 [Myxococcales bacterium]|nr:hypothetical protein [Myxococcales bacterium]